MSDQSEQLCYHIGGEDTFAACWRILLVEKGMTMKDDKALVQLQFEDYRIRRIMDEDTGEWWYAVVDVIEALTDSNWTFDIVNQAQERLSHIKYIYN
jgi:hypothetical protein